MDFTQTPEEQLSTRSFLPSETVVLTTTLNIAAFPTPLSSLIAPNYLAARPDGSLVTPLYAHDARDASILLFSATLFGVVFFRNVAVTYRYIRRISTPDMTLFYLLLFSQIWGPIACGVLLLPLVSSTVNCTGINIVAAASIQLSFSVLVSGILGLKAYRCLNRSRAVLIAICLSQVTAWILTAFDLPHLGSERSLADICIFKKDLRLLPTAFILSSIETLVFVSMCFGYAVWNTSKRTATLGRISLDSPTRASSPAQPLRGWWDYAPSQAQASRVHRDHTGSTISQSVAPSRQVARSNSVAASSWKQGRSAWAIFPFTAARNRGPHTGWEKMQEAERVARPVMDWVNGSRKPPKVAGTILLDEAVRSELFYTAVILVFHSIAMVMVPISIKFERVWPPVFWLGCSWSITSVLIIQSFEPVVKRHEREAILREHAALGPDPLDAPSGPPPPMQTPWGRPVSFSTNSVFSTPGRTAVARTPAATVWTVANADGLGSVDGLQPDVWRRGSVSGISTGSAASRPRMGLRQVPNAYTAPGQAFAALVASVPVPVLERRTSIGSIKSSAASSRRGSAESLLP